MTVTKTAIVVGGGLAGMAAALALTKAGVSVQLLEARRRLGGRTGSFTKLESHATLDYCQHVGMGCCTNLRKWIDWLGQREHWECQQQLHFYGPEGRYRRLAAMPWLPAPLHLAGWLWRWPGLEIADRIAVARGMLRLRKLSITTQTDRASATEWLVQHLQTPRAMEHFWSTIIVSALGEELAHVNLSSVAKVLQDGFLNHREAFHLLVPRRPLAELFGTFAEQKLREHGVDILLQKRVQRIVQVAERRFALDAPQLSRLSPDAIIIAVPWFRMRDLVEQTGQSQLTSISQCAEQLVSSPISGIHTWWDRPWLDTPHAAIVGRLCQWVFPKHEAKRASESTQPEYYYQIVVSASRQLPNSDKTKLMAAVHQDLSEVFPKVRAAKLLRMQVVTDPQAVFSVDVNSHALRPHAEVAGTNLWLAGDWVQTGWPATMEGAILSGWTAAEGILASWGKPVRFAAPPLNAT